MGFFGTNKVSKELCDNLKEENTTLLEQNKLLEERVNDLWKVNTYYSVQTLQEQFPFVDHHNCRLGKWYYEGEGQENFSNSSSFKSLETPHSLVHNATQKVFDNLTQENLNNENIMQALQEMESASQNIFLTLDRIFQDKGQK